MYRTVFNAPFFSPYFLCDLTTELICVFRCLFNRASLMRCQGGKRHVWDAIKTELGWGMLGDKVVAFVPIPPPPLLLCFCCCLLSDVLQRGPWDQITPRRRTSANQRQPQTAELWQRRGREGRERRGTAIMEWSFPPGDVCPINV